MSGKNFSNLGIFNLSQDQFISIADKNESAVLFREINSDLLTPISAFLKISKNFPNYHFLLESAENSLSKGRFSVIGILPDLIWQCRGQNSFLAEISKDSVSQQPNFKRQNGNPLENLRHLIRDSKIDWKNYRYKNDQLPAICAGIFGYFGYDMVRLMEKLPDRNLKDDLQNADAIFIRPRILVVFDALFSRALICAPFFCEKNSVSNKKEQNFAEIYEFLTNKITEICQIIENETIPSQISTDFRENSKKLLEKNFSENPQIEKIGDFYRLISAKKYQQMVVKAKEYITAGDIFQVLPSQRFYAEFPEKTDEFNFYRSLRSLNPSPFLFFLRFDDFVLTGSSPEIMVSLKKDKVIVRPLAGTRKRGKNEQEDREIAAELLADEKEIAEHLMLIDLGRNDVGMIAKPGSVLVSKQMAIEFYSHVMHISSTVEGILREDKDALDALIAAFPAGTVSGAPKIRAMEIIEELEDLKRGFYSGCVGYFASNGEMETCITLRSALIKNHQIYLQSGAGVVFDSDPEFENQECLNKAQVLMRAFEVMKY